MIVDGEQKVLSGRSHVEIEAQTPHMGFAPVAGSRSDDALRLTVLTPGTHVLQRFLYHQRRPFEGPLRNHEGQKPEVATAGIQTA